ncbi:MAG: M15 family metallopeptidase [Flavobacteriales bacterium]|nr:M15 family metallopeptidase [Flavobacteriales bacterium]
MKKISKNLYSLFFAVALVSIFSFNVQQSASISKTDLLGKFTPSSHPDFVKIDAAYASNGGMYMRKEAYDSFLKMYEAAKKENIVLTIISATRNFDRQKTIWEKKWKLEKYKGWKDFDKAKDILNYSSMPGTSRHHWGTDIDLNSVSPKDFETGGQKKVYEWLVKNASSFGFSQTYTAKTAGRTGYSEEKWHWSYMPLAKKFLADYNRQISYTDITDFSGCAQAQPLEVIREYVNGIEVGLK